MIVLKGIKRERQSSEITLFANALHPTNQNFSNYFSCKTFLKLWPPFPPNREGVESNGQIWTRYCEIQKI